MYLGKFSRNGGSVLMDEPIKQLMDRSLTFYALAEMRISSTTKLPLESQGLKVNSLYFINLFLIYPSSLFFYSIDYFTRFTTMEGRVRYNLRRPNENLSKIHGEKK